MRILIISIFLIFANNLYAVNYANDANCLQCFVLDDGTANTNDRSSGGRNLTLANGAWEAGNIGYTFDADATGSFTPGLTSWQTTDITIAVLTTVSNTASHKIYYTYVGADTNRRLIIGSNPNSAYNRATCLLGRQYEANAYGTCFVAGDSSKQWVFAEFETAISSCTMYKNGVKNTLGYKTVSQYGTMAMDTGQLGNGSSNTIFQVATFNRLLTPTEMLDITANGLIGSTPAVSGFRPKTTHVYGGVID